MNYTPNEPPRAMSAAEIEEILPHRYPFALVDKILDYTPGQWARGVKCVTRTEPFFEGHFPGHPVMPGVLILEALAQTGAVAALSLPENRGKLALFGGIKNACFRRQVLPGDVLTLECELVEQHGPEPVVLREKGVPQVSIPPKPQCKKAPPAQRKREILERLKAYRDEYGTGCFASLEDKAGVNASLLRGLLTGETKADMATWEAVDKALDKLEKAHG